MVPGVQFQDVFGSESEEDAEDTMAEPNLAQVLKKLDTVIRSQKFIAAEFESMKSCNLALRKENDELRVTLNEATTELKIHQFRIDALESNLNEFHQQRLSSHMCIAGIPVTENENLKQVVSEIGSVLNIEVAEEDILHAHRMQSKSAAQTIQVVFASTSMKQRYIESRKSKRPGAVTPNRISTLEANKYCHYSLLRLPNETQQKPLQ